MKALRYFTAFIATFVAACQHRPMERSSQSLNASIETPQQAEQEHSRSWPLVYAGELDLNRSQLAQKMLDALRSHDAWQVEEHQYHEGKEFTSRAWMSVDRLRMQAFLESEMLFQVACDGTTVEELCPNGLSRDAAPDGSTVETLPGSDAKVVRYTSPFRGGVQRMHSVSDDVGCATGGCSITFFDSENSTFGNSMRRIAEGIKPVRCRVEGVPWLISEWNTSFGLDESGTQRGLTVFHWVDAETYLLRGKVLLVTADGRVAAVRAKELRWKPADPSDLRWKTRAEDAAAKPPRLDGVSDMPWCFRRFPVGSRMSSVSVCP